MIKYTIEYSLQGSLEIEADTPEEAIDIYREQYSWDDLVYDDNRSVERDERSVKEILQAVFENNNEKAQKLIEETANDWYESYGRKTQAKCDRTIFVA